MNLEVEVRRLADKGWKGVDLYFGGGKWTCRLFGGGKDLHGPSPWGEGNTKEEAFLAAKKSLEKMIEQKVLQNYG